MRGLLLTRAIILKFLNQSAVILLVQTVSSLHLVLHVPRSAPAGFDIMLSCLVDLEGDILYSLKWFRNEKEFYRFEPSEDPPVMFFPLKGIKIDFVRSTNTTVVLKDSELSTTGMYRCEASADAPLFTTVTAEAFLIVGEFYNGSVQHRGNTVLFITSFMIAIKTIVLKQSLTL